MAYKKLKTFKSYGVERDGSRTGNHRLSVDQQIYIESSGACRLFVKVPDYVAGALGSFTYGNCVLTTVGDKTAAGPEDILAGRDPDQLEPAWNKICEAYALWVNSQDLTPCIAFELVGKHNFGRQRGEEFQAEFNLRFFRYLRNNTPNAHKDYKWRDDETKALEHIWKTETKDHEIVPYTPELWAQLLQLRDQINGAHDRVQGLIKTQQLAKRITSGGQLLLGKD